MSSEKASRRQFLGQGLIGLVSLGILGWHHGFVLAQAEPATPAAGPLIDRGVKFLRSRQDAEGDCMTQPASRDHGTGGHGTAPLGTGSSGRSHRDSRLQVPRRLHRCQGGAIRGPSRQLLDLDRPGGIQQANVNGRYDRVIQAGQDFLKSMPGTKAKEDRETTRFTAGTATAAAIAGQIYPTPPSSWKPCATPGCRPMTPTCKRRWFSCPDARI